MSFYSLNIFSELHSIEACLTAQKPINQMRLIMILPQRETQDQD